MQVNQISGDVDINHIVPYFQPIIDLNTMAVCSYECLARMVTASQHMFLPSEFLTLVEKEQCSGKLAQRIFNLSAQYFRETRMAWSINISHKDICDGEFLGFLQQALGDYPSPQRVTLEVKGEVAVTCAANFRRFVDWCQQNGIRVMVDRYNPAEKDISDVLKLPVQGIKLDGSVTHKLLHDDAMCAVVAELVEQAKQRQIQVVAEHVEQQQELEAIKALNIRYAQGFLFSYPSASVKR